MADRLLKKLDVRETEILVNSVGDRKCRPAYLQDLRAAASAVEPSLCPDCQRKAATNPLRIFDCKVESCRELARSFPEITGYLCPECEDHFRRFRGHLDLFGIPYLVEPHLVRGIDYYTRTTFEIAATALGAQNSVLGGGRYDDLMKEYGGPDMPAIGFAIGLERLLSVAGLKMEPHRFVFLAYLGDEAKSLAMSLARFLREHGIECLLEFKERSLKNQLARASKLQAAWAVIVGEEEVRKARFQVKNLSTGRQQDAGKDELVEVLRRSDF
jgi:histidyl-tRNA synthetase